MSEDRYRDAHAPQAPSVAESDQFGVRKAVREVFDAIGSDLGLARNVGDTIARVRDIAKTLGWAIGAHGSLVRDIDLIAAPWTLAASPWRVLVAAVAAGIGCRSRLQDVERAHGRICVLLIADGADNDQLRFNRGETAELPDPKGRWYPPAIDLSIVDPRAANLDHPKL